MSDIGIGLTGERFTVRLEFRADIQTRPVVHGEYLDCSSADRSQTDDRHSLPFEVFRPTIAPGVKQRDELASLWV
jgi:hypothetical protein